MPSDEIGGFNDAQKILQEQLVEKQNYLQTVIQNQKKQLTQIQRQICLNAQAQFSLHEVKDLEMSKQLQRQAQILELERKQQEARQRELKSLVVQKINPTTAHTSDTKIIQDYCQSSDLSLSRASYSNIATSGQDQRTSLSTPSSISDGFVGRHECVTYNTQPITPAEYVTTRSIVSYTKTAESSASGATGVDYVPTTCDQRVCSSLSREGIQPSTSSQNVLPKTLVDDTSKQLSFKQLNSASVNSTITGTITHTVDSLTQRTSVSTSGSKDYFSKFSSEKLETFLCTSSLPPTTTSSSAQQTHVTTSGTKDYFSKFSSSELETFLSTTSLPPTTPSSSSGESSSNGGTEKGEQSAPSSYDTLLLQQKQLLEMQEVRKNVSIKRAYH